jgi:phage shock protein A
VRRLDEALERLERAVARLEAACAQGGAGIEAVRRAAAAEAATVQLRAAAGDIADRVDGALGRIGRALAGELAGKREGEG